jgi:hypothetical protein
VVAVPPAEPEVTVDDVLLEIDSDPSGAEIAIADEVVGETPYSTRVARTDDALGIRLTKGGYEELETSIVPSRDRRVAYELDRRRDADEGEAVTPMRPARRRRRRGRSAGMWVPPRLP